ncbi:4-hydroxy-tetrahydrodipicolinate reductase [Microbacterium aurantiacum]|uniref:4-hydroxy-tetrahydrodipicolinate reductase n=1 Tax=Microbacterium aurantiacum TaxID=162393 RepID=A0AAJ2HL39_9MICO|nr:4-hydroxy-tetrahydrodipicolinate reductase [Microbacterium aurantiacum]MDS0246764.1 4-hydroxy-tetrahydrodipicolinate reductase [Microbacterium aurantiacum]
MTTRVAIVGGTGKLGRIICDVLAAEADYDVAAVLTSRSPLTDLDGADLVIDASVPAVSIDVVRAAAERGIDIIVGTSGWSAERIALVRPAIQASGIAALFVPNFSLGSVLGSAIAAAAAPFFPSVEIIEAHRETKIDSPSGTAVRTAELIADARREVGPVAAPYVDQRARGQQVASIPVHSLRRPGVVARQETVLSGPGESLTIVHDTVEPAQAYGPGIRLALGAVRDLRGVTVGLDSLIDIGIGRPVPGDVGDGGVDDGGAPGQVARATGV